MSIDVTAMSMEKLKELQAQVAKEIITRNSNSLVVYTHHCKDRAGYHLNKYKHWAKLVISVDTSKTNGYAFQGDFLKVSAEHKVPVGSVIVEVCDRDITGYVMEAEGKRLAASGNTNSMSNFIEDIAALFK